MRANSRQQLARGKRFDEVIVGAGLKAFDRGLLPGAGGQENHRHHLRHRVVSQRTEQTEAVKARHHHIGQHQVWRILQGRRQCGGPIRHGNHVMLGLQEPRHIRPHVGIVVHPQHPRTRLGPRLQLTLDRCDGGGDGFRKPEQRFLHVSRCCATAAFGTVRRTGGFHAFRGEMLMTGFEGDGELAADPLLTLHGHRAGVSPHELLDE